MGWYRRLFNLTKPLIVGDAWIIGCQLFGGFASKALPKYILASCCVEASFGDPWLVHMTAWQQIVAFES